mmetsp:Transcript_41274/g.58063  ORF Transcript_41274/g.58063 Transcript_41274/m.58063 type:complete len:82 (-) Transcript_41274:132-377(-)
MTNPPIQLFRSLLREAKKMDNYNFRAYSIRRVKTGFKMNKDLSGNEATSALAEGHQQLEMLKRQAMLGQLYPSVKSVMQTS